MYILPNLVREFDEMCAAYEAVNDQGRDLVALIKKFGNKCDSSRLETEPDLAAAWDEFLEEHKHQVTVTMVGVILYVLITYWNLGQALFDALPTMEKMVFMDTVQQMSDEIDLRSAASGDMVIAASE